MPIADVTRERRAFPVKVAVAAHQQVSALASSPLQETLTLTAHVVPTTFVSEGPKSS